MKPLFTSILLVAGFVVLPQHDLVNDLLTVHVIAAEAQINRRPSNGADGYGETVAFSVQAEFRCRGRARAESIVVSISDTHYRHIPAEGDESMGATVVVPGDQIPPAETGGFCSGEEYRGGDLLLLPAVATAHVSLRCRADAASSISFVSVPLPLKLVCRGETGQEPPASARSPGR